MSIPSVLKREVIKRAKSRCEYCGLAQVGQEAAFHIDHVVPVTLRGPTTLDNLALACVSCSLRKGARTMASDPKTGRQAALFNPRKQLWSEHFSWRGLRVLGHTDTGRATITTLRLNRTLILAIRAEEILRHRHPPA
jgi:hypothetical protein